MGKKVKIITLVSLAGPDMSLTAGDEWEVDEAVAEARIALGLALPVDPPVERQTVTHGEQQVETAAVDPAAETRAARPRRQEKKKDA
jgi:hypothetical protein